MNNRSNLGSRCYYTTCLTHWGRVTHICVSRLTITGSDNGLSPGWRQAIIRTKSGISENLIEIITFSFTKMQLKVSSAKWWPFCLSLNVLNWSWELVSLPYVHLSSVMHSAISTSTKKIASVLTYFGESCNKHADTVFQTIWIIFVPVFLGSNMLSCNPVEPAISVANSFRWQ